MRVVDLRPDAELFKEVRGYFPHPEPRRFQADLANQVYDFLVNGYRDLVVECPTGLGKVSRPA